MTSGLGALLLADARLPVGGHTYSAGLEPALIAGMPAELIPVYMTARLRTAGLVEAAASVLAHRAAGGGDGALVDARALEAVHEELLARSPSDPLREISGMLGRGLVRLAARLRPDHPAVAALRALGRAPQRPVALGVVAAVLGAGEAETARVSLYDDAQTVASAALKLAPVDPVDAAGWVLSAEGVMTSVAAEALAVRDAADLPASTAPQIEGWSLEHRNKTRRIFIA
ncbi:urease accessory protein UreF [Nocardiopsis sp. NPDC101807]|uniref:urease accessory protein UreF n=1 Tax=Nocardiopsis sp. NPDC101807 TaxID=3364339 RepID=UPI0038251417